MIIANFFILKHYISFFSYFLRIILLFLFLNTGFRNMGFWGFGEIGRASCRER